MYIYIIITMILIIIIIITIIIIIVTLVVIFIICLPLYNSTRRGPVMLPRAMNQPAMAAQLEKSADSNSARSRIHSAHLARVYTHVISIISILIVIIKYEH